MPCVLASGSSASVIVAPRKPRPRSSASTRGDQAAGRPPYAVYAAFETMTRGTTPAAIARRYGTRPGASAGAPASIVTASSSVDTVASPRPGKCFRVGTAPPSSRPGGECRHPLRGAHGERREPASLGGDERAGNAGHVRDGREIDVDAEALERGRGLPSSAPDRALGEPPQLLGRGRRRRPAKAPDETSLLVGRDQDAPATRPRGSAKARRQRAHLGRRADVRAHEDHPSDPATPDALEEPRARRSAVHADHQRGADELGKRDGAAAPAAARGAARQREGDDEAEADGREARGGSRRSRNAPSTETSSSPETENGRRHSSDAWPSIVSRHSYRPGSSRSGPELIATGKSSGVPGLRPAGRPTSNGTSSKKTIGSAAVARLGVDLDRDPVGVEELEPHHVPLVRLVPRDADQDRDPERRRLRPGQRPAAADHRELAVAHLGEVGQQHRHAHEASLAQGGAEVTPRTAGRAIGAAPQVRPDRQEGFCTHRDPEVNGEVKICFDLLPRLGEAEVDLARRRIGPAGGDDLPTGVEVDRLGPVGVRVAEERRLPAAERVVRDRHGTGTLIPTILIDVELELTRGAAVASEERDAVAVRVVVDDARLRRRRCRRAQRRAGARYMRERYASISVVT